jgi:hypothetical protein
MITKLFGLFIDSTLSWKLCTEQSLHRLSAAYYVFFQVRSVVNDTRQNIDFASLDLHVVLQEFSQIS